MGGSFEGSYCTVYYLYVYGKEGGLALFDVRCGDGGLLEGVRQGSELW